MTTNAAAIVCLLACAAEATAAADEAIREVVVLDDGSIIQGELVEKRVGDHVTVKLADGTTQRFDWGEVKSATEDTTPVASTGDTDEDVLVKNWPEPDRTPPATAGPQLGIGLFGGADLAGGLIGGEILRDWTSWFESDLGVGFAGKLGSPSVTAMLRVGLPLASIMRTGIALGDSIGVVPGKYTTSGMSRLSNSLQPGVFFDVRLAHHLLLRYSAGAAILLGPSHYDLPCYTPFGGVGAAQPGHCPTAFITFNGEIAWMFDL